MNNPTSGYFRGYPIRQEPSGEFVFVDTGNLVSATWEERPCGFCGLENTVEGHDGCLGSLRGIINACCGHGISADAYVQFDDGAIIRNEDALRFFETNRRKTL